jgi:ATP-binding cassette subfamily B protein
MMLSLIDSVQVVLMGASVMVTVWLISPWIAPVVVIAAFPALVIEWRVASAVQELQRRTATERHFLGRIVDVVRDRNAAMELRLFGNGPALANRFLATRTAMDQEQFVAESRQMRAGVLSESLRGLAIGIAAAIALWTITDQRLSLGTWVVATTGIQWLSGMMRFAVQAVREARENVSYAGDLFAFEDQAAALIADERRIRAETPAETEVASPRGPMRVELNGVSFAYPGSDASVVRHVTLAIPPGQTVAIVGENGAGKSTLVRLVAVLYLPDAGVVRLDGINTRSDGMDAMTPRIAAVFQDYLSFQLPLRDNIGFGAVDGQNDPDRLERAARQANLDALIATLPEGHDTWLGREFGERDLSGGQWQRLALARAFYRDADLVIFDEPTAALDPKAELALFERFADLVEDRTAIMISHRLGPARFADRILVMEDGAIVEDGHHDELMAANGPYARMFAAQAMWYQPATG